MGQAKHRAAKILPKAIVGGIFGRFSNFDKCRPEVVDDVIPGVAVALVNMDVPVKFEACRHMRPTILNKCVFRDLRLNRSVEIRPKAVETGIFSRFFELR